MTGEEIVLGPLPNGITATVAGSCSWERSSVCLLPLALSFRRASFVHGPAQESVAQRLKNDVPGLSFLERKDTM